MSSMRPVRFCDMASCDIIHFADIIAGFTINVEYVIMLLVWHAKEG